LEVTVLPIENDVLDIVRSAAKGGNALSLYLDTDPSRGAGRNLKAEMADTLREMRDSLGDADHTDALEQAAAAAMEAINSLQPIPRAVAAFVRPGIGYLRVVPLPEPVARSAHWGPELYVRPLLVALDEHQRTVVALVDQEHGHVFRVFLGQIEEVASLEHKEPGHAQAGRSQRKSMGSGHGVAAWMAYGERNLQRRHDWHVHRHLERVVEAMRLDGDRLLVGGGRETVLELLRLLPRRVRDRTTVMTGISAEASTAVVLERVLETQRQAEWEEERALLETLLEAEHARSVFGVAAVAEAVSDARVHTLAYASSTEMTGAECTGCGWLMPGPKASSCPRCGAALVERPEFVERLVARVFQSGGRVEEVRGPARESLLDKDGLAALLRYVPLQLTREEAERTASSTTQRVAAGHPSGGSAT
jgi:predicted Zn-ribbon and HTH transcriptional regulator